MNSNQSDRQSRFPAAAIPIGAGGGVALGVVLMNVMNHPGFFAVGLAIGLSLSIAIGLAVGKQL